jgi:hypothetical protein
VLISGADLRSLGFLLSDCLYEFRRDEFDPIIMAMRRAIALKLPAEG